MPEVMISGSREPLSASHLAADVVAIGADAIRASTADSVADLLRREAGIQLSRNGGPGQTTGLLLRGASSGQTVVLVDGVRIGSATLGSAALEALALSQVDRIEVLRGPGSSLYGADAVGGVVQIFTRAGAAGMGLGIGTPQWHGALAVGGYDSREASAGVRGGSALWDYAASAASERSSNAEGRGGGGLTDASRATRDDQLRVGDFVPERFSDHVVGHDVPPSIGPTSASASSPRWCSVSRGVARRGSVMSGTPMPSARRWICWRWRSRRSRPKSVDEASAALADADSVIFCALAAIAGVFARPGRSVQHELTTAGSSTNPMSALSSSPSSNASVTGVSSGSVTIIA